MRSRVQFRRALRDLRRPHYPNEDVTLEKRVADLCRKPIAPRYRASRRRVFSNIRLILERSAPAITGASSEVRKVRRMIPGVNWLRVITSPRNASLIFNAGGGDGFTRANELVVGPFSSPLPSHIANNSHRFKTQKPSFIYTFSFI